MREICRRNFRRKCITLKLGFAPNRCLKTSSKEINTKCNIFLMKSIELATLLLNNNQYLKMLKRHSWKSLRKFNSVKKLAEARIFKEYPHLQRNFLEMIRLIAPTRRFLCWKRLKKYYL